jgi:hypothetical protein
MKRMKIKSLKSMTIKSLRQLIIYKSLSTIPSRKFGSFLRHSCPSEKYQTSGLHS